MTTTHAPILKTVEEARRIVLEQAAPLGIEQVRLEASIGRVLAQDILAQTDLPPFDNSAMDGYCLWSIDTTNSSRENPVKLRLVGEVAAGEVADRPLGRGEAVRITTGSPLPAGANSVVMLEEARLRGREVWIFQEVMPGSHVRKAGEDIREGGLALSAGTLIQFQHLGLLAGLGCASVCVYRRPSVAVMATGSELLDIDEPLTPGKIRNSNSLLLACLLRRLGILPTDLGVVADDRESICQQLKEAVKSDVILISGGVSVGEHDLVKRVLRDLGMETLFWRVNMKPGKPLLFGRLPAAPPTGNSTGAAPAYPDAVASAGRQAGWRDKAVFGLPGNPISCVVCFVEFIMPFLRSVMGDRHPDGLRVQARLTQPLRKKEPRTQFFTSRLGQDQTALTVTPTPQQGSGMLNSLAQADALIVVAEATMQLEAGDVVEVIPLGGQQWLW